MPTILRLIFVLTLGLLGLQQGGYAYDGHYTQAAENAAPRLRLNVFGEGEARGFLDVSTNPKDKIRDRLKTIERTMGFMLILESTASHVLSS